MSIIHFNCSCGNTDPTKARAYDGALGYEAIVCTVCGRYSDYNGEHPADGWSIGYIAGMTCIHATEKYRIGRDRIGGWQIIRLSDCWDVYLQPGDDGNQFEAEVTACATAEEYDTLCGQYDELMQGRKS